MPEAERFDMLVLGSGEGGKYLAWQLARSGQRVAVVERKLIGGACPNTNCLPSKNEIWSAKVADLVRHADRFGSPAAAGVDMKRVLARKREMVDGLIAMHLELYKASSAELIMGSGRFAAPKTIEVALERRRPARARRRSGRARSGDPCDHPGLPGSCRGKTHDQRGTARTRPAARPSDCARRRLCRPGAGGGLSPLRQPGHDHRSGVSIRQPRGSRRRRSAPRNVTRRGDRGAARHQGVACRGPFGRVGRTCGANPGRRAKARRQRYSGRGRPNAQYAGVGLDLAGVELDPRGYIAVNDRLETSAPGVWAIGECAGSPQFTHASLDDFRIIRDNLAGGARSTRGRLIPYCLFTDPQLARVGLSEDEAKRQGVAVRVAKLPIMAVLRSRTISETLGFMKALVGADHDRILGFTMFGPEAGEVVAVVQTAMLAAMPFTALRDAILTHPTMAEGLGPLLSLVPTR